MTRNEPSYREKGRSLFLAALMVISVVAGSAAFAGSAAANDDIGNDELDGTDLYIGEELVMPDLSDGWYEIHAGLNTDDDDPVLVQVEDGEGLSFDTSELERGPHTITNATAGGDDVDGVFVMYEMDLEANFEENVTNNQIEEGDNSELVVDFGEETERNYTVTITETDGQLSDDQLEAIFPDDATVDDGEVEVTIQDNGEDNVSVDFGDSDADLNLGEYEFEVESADTGDTDTASVEIVEEAEANVNFVDDRITENVGDVVSIELDVENTEKAAETDITVNLSETLDSEYYEATIPIDVQEDQLDDGENLILEFDTYKAANGEDAADVVEVTQGGQVVTGDLSEDIQDVNDWQSEFNLTTGTYNLDVYPGNPSDTGVTIADMAQLTLEDRSLDDISTGIAPADDLDFENGDVTVEDIENATSSYSDVAEGDSLVFEVEASGIYSNLTDDDGNFSQEAVDEHNLSVVFEDTEEQRFGEGESFNLIDYADTNAINIVEDADENRFFIVVDTGSSEFDEAELSVDSEWDVTFEIGETNRYVEEAESVTTSFSVEEGELAFDTVEEPYQVTMDGEDAWTVYGESTYFAPGTEVDVTAQSNLLYVTETVEVEEVDGERTFQVNIEPEDTEDITEGHSFSLSLNEQDSIDAVISNEHESETSSEASELEAYLSDLREQLDVESNDELLGAIEELQTENEAVDELLTEYEVENVTELQEKINTLENDSDELETLLEDNEVDNATELQELINGLESDLEDAQSERDSLQNDLDDMNSTIEDAGYDSLDDLVTAANEKGSTDDGSTDDSSSDDNSSDDESDDGTPGFGVAVAAIALLAAAMLALRRQH